MSHSDHIHAGHEVSSESSDKDKCQRILYVNLSFIGDCVLSTHIPAAIKELHPGCEVYVLSTKVSNAIFKSHPLVDGTLTMDKRNTERGLGGILAKAKEIKAHGFDIVYTTHRSPRTALILYLSGIPKRVCFSDARLKFLYTDVRRRIKAEHDVVRSLSLFGGYDVIEKLPKDLCVVSPSDEQVSEELRSMLKGRDYILMVPGSVWYTKQYKASRYGEVARKLARDHTVVLMGAPSEKHCGEIIEQYVDDNVINLIGKTSLAESFWVVKNARGLICNDSMSLHLGSAFKVPTVTIFCATSPYFGFGPWLNNAQIVQSTELSCKPCARHGSKTCPLGHGKCTDVDSGRVVQAVLSAV